MSLTSWLRPRKSTRRASRPRPRCRLGVEALETRNLMTAGWVNSAAGGTFFVDDLAADAGGPGHAASVYVAGGFQGAVDFHPGFTDGKLTSVNGVANAFLTKYAADGTFQWTRQIGGPNGEEAKSVAVDAAGNVSLVGYLQGQVTAGPAAGLTSAGDADVLVARFDPAGNLAWAKAFGGTGSDGGYGIAADDAGVYLTGQFSGTANFGGIALTGPPTGTNVFVTRLDPTTGAAIYASRAGNNTTGGDRGNAIAVDAAHDAYVTGLGYDNPQFGSTTLTGYVRFLTKVDESGQFVWAQAAGIPYDVAVDQGSGAVYLTTDHGVTRIDGNGQTIWDRTFVNLPGSNPNNSMVVSRLATDTAGNVYLKFDLPIGAASFGPGGPLVFDSAAIAKLSSAGDLLSGWQDPGTTLAVDSAGTVYAGGTFTGTVAFDTGVQTVSRTSSGTLANLFVVQVSPDQGAFFGNLYLDANQNGVRDAGENPLGARTVYADLNNNGVRNAGEPFAVTGIGGLYHLNHLAAGTYKIRQELPTGFSSTTTPATVNLAAGQFVNGFNFGSYSATAVHTYTNSTPMSIVGAKPTTIVSSTLKITDNLTINDLNVRVNITAPDDYNLALWGVPKLVAPDGTTIQLARGARLNGVVVISGANLTNTVFDDESPLALMEGTAPYTGTFRSGDQTIRLSDLNGMSLKGTWKLEFAYQTAGTLNNWSIIATASPTTVGGSSGVAASPVGPLGTHHSGGGDMMRREAERLAIAAFLRHLNRHG